MKQQKLLKGNNKQKRLEDFKKRTVTIILPKHKKKRNQPIEYIKLERSESCF